MKTKTKMKIKMNYEMKIKVFAFLLTPHSLEVPQMVNSLLLGVEVPQHFDCEFTTWPSGAIDRQLSLDWPRSAMAPRNMAPSLI